MNGPFRHHIERRASRKPARQYVSDTHDHKPDAPPAVRSRIGGFHINQNLVRLVESTLLSDAEITSREIVKRLDGYSSASCVRNVLRFLVAQGRASFEGQDGKRRYRKVEAA